MVGTSGAAAQRCGDSTANALTLPPLTSGNEFDASGHNRSRCPATRSWFAGAAPRYGTNPKRVPVWLWKVTPHRCETPPQPTAPIVALSGLALSQATSSLTLLAGSAALPMIHTGAIVSNATGVRSFTRSYGS